MKLIKSFEKFYHNNDGIENEYKFKIGDIVKLTDEFRKFLEKDHDNISLFFRIVTINDDPHTLLRYNIESLTIDSQYFWAHDDFLIKVDDKETDQNKYNL